MRQNIGDNFFVGFLIGAMVPIAGYVLIGQLFELLAHFNLMESVSLSTSGKRERTILILSIACNILAIQYLTRRRWGVQSIKGVVAATLVYAGFWFYTYYDILLHNF